MVTTELAGNTGTRFIGGVLSIEFVSVLGDMRWMLLLIVLCVIADFRYGWGESSKRYEEAKRNGDKMLMMQYAWRTSRALRRTINKLIDYVVWAVVGMAVGMAILEPMGVNHIFGGVVATAIAVLCEAKSFFGHFFYLHGVTYNDSTFMGFAKAFIVALAKRKSEDMGAALEESLNEEEQEKHHESKLHIDSENQGV